MSRRHRLLTVSVIVGCVIGVAAMTRGQRSREDVSSEHAYKVTAWPDNIADKSYNDLVEAHLNEMASRGYRLNSTVFAQGARMMIFERREERQP